MSGQVGPFLGQIGRLTGIPVRITDDWHGPGAVQIGAGASGLLVLPRTRPTARFPLYEHYATIDAGPGRPPITPWYFDPAKWPERQLIDYGPLG